MNDDIADRRPSGALLTILAMTILCSGPRNAFAAYQKPRGEHTLSATNNLRPFTVADSIAMTHFEVPFEGASNSAPVSPDGRKCLVITERGLLEKNVREYSLLVYSLNDPNSRPVVAARFQSSSNRPAISQPQWLDNRQISFLGELVGGVPQIYIADWQGARRKKVTADPQGVASYAISDNQTKVAHYSLWDSERPDDKYREDHGLAVTDEQLYDLVSGGWRRHSYLRQLHIIDLATGKTRTTQPHETYGVTPSIWMSPNGRYAIVERVPSSVPSKWIEYDDPFVKQKAREWLNYKSKLSGWGLTETLLVDTETGDMRPLIGAPSSVGMSLTTVVWSADSLSVVVGSTLLPLNVKDEEELAKRRAHPVIAAVDIKGGSARRILETRVDESWELKRGSEKDTFLITGWKREPGGELTNPMATRGFQRYKGEWDEDKAFVEKKNSPGITIREALDRWPVLVKVDPVTDQEKIILDPNPQFKQFRFGRRQVVHWIGKQGEALTGGLVYPAEYVPGTRYSLVIQTHGFSPNAFLLDGSFTTAMAAEELANKEIAVLQLPQSELEVANLCNRGPATQSQIESAVDYLDSIGLIDRTRVGLVGFSSTGFSVRNALIHSTYHFAAVTSAEGNDWGYWSYLVWGNSAGWAAQSECPYGGPPWNNNWATWLKKSISFNYDKVHAPLRLESDGNDYAQVLNEWENFIALKRLRKPVELVFISHGDHPVVKPWDRLTSQQGNVDWMVFWLKDEEDPDPAKAEQYKRWHELRKLQEQDEANTKAQSRN
jgi:dipeptidyl aminopeptidase/acylaminoacyl peptidase